MDAHSLTERELEILCLIAEGLSNQEIADALILAPETIKWYNKQIFSKLDVHNRTQAVARAKVWGLLNPPDSPSPLSLLQAKTNLHAQVTSFIGRHRELIAIKQSLEGSRLMTLTGIGGAGKTRLALQVAMEVLLDFSDGVYFVPLTSVSTVDGVIWAIAEHLDFQFNSFGEPFAQLLDYFREKTLLLVLDNFDHLLASAGVITEILHAAPAVKILVTSRERLSVYGEFNYPVEGLVLPSENKPEDAARAEAAQLFIERAQSVSPNLAWSEDDLRHIGRICRLVGGMPLGIELAATWVDALSPNEIANEIEQNLDILEAERRDLPHNQHSIRAAFDRSWRLLDEAQQTAFRRLSVFQGGFTREAGEAVTGVALRTLQALVNKSLLRRNPHTGRYEFHELLRHYAKEQLRLSDEVDATAQAHATYFADFMAERWSHLKDRRQKRALAEIEADIENTRAAWHYWINARDVGQLSKFLHSFWVVYDIRGWYPAGVELFKQAAALMRTLATDEAQLTLGWLLAVEGLYSVAGGYRPSVETLAPSWMAGHGVYSIGGTDVRYGFTLAQEGIRLLTQSVKHESMMIIPLICQFITACLLDEQGVPLRTAQELLEVATNLEDTWAIAKANQFLAVRAIEDGEFEKAERLAHEALAVFDDSGDNWSKSVVCIEALGLLAITLQQFEAAKDWMLKGLKAAEEIGFKYSIQSAYWQLGFIASLEGRYGEAGRYWREALRIADGILGSASVIGFGGSSRVTEWGGRRLSKRTVVESSS